MKQNHDCLTEPTVVWNRPYFFLKQTLRVFETDPTRFVTDPNLFWNSLTFVWQSLQFFETDPKVFWKKTRRVFETNTTFFETNTMLGRRNLKLVVKIWNRRGNYVTLGGILERLRVEWNQWGHCGTVAAEVQTKKNAEGPLAVPTRAKRARASRFVLRPVCRPIFANYFLEYFLRPFFETLFENHFGDHLWNHCLRPFFEIICWE